MVTVAGGDDAAEFVGDGFEAGRIRRRGRVCGDFECECLVLAVERVEARIQGG